VEYLDSRWHSYSHCCHSKDGVSHRSHSDGKHVVCPYHETKKCNQHRRKNHRCITEQTLLRKGCKYFAKYTKDRQYQYIYFCVSKSPKQMHPNNRNPAKSNVKKRQSEHTLKHQ